MRWFCKRVALHHIRQRSRKVVENKIQTQHLGWFLWNVLRVDGASVLTYLMSQRHEQRACTCRRIITSDATEVRLVAHKQPRHNLRYGMRCVIFGIFSATGVVEPFQQILEDVWEEIIFLAKYILKVERSHIVHQSFGKLITLLCVGNICSQRKENIHFALSWRGDRESVGIERGNVNESSIEQCRKVTFGGRIIKVR